ncbi:capsular biosynthesis protein [Shewanella submarina]|uniref:Capsular biosynthesis protein n=1 Tax=Shewanella submarina TaxID=2016376 RepID=A0ABV7GCB5_9GAMM|nr:capsular biosynthesis protein [Shewanella submarina]MCL1038780.1 capsular biosynthesis protein [Shewanella submarina]
MYLITSAAFVDSELQSEFGPLPPSFLPVGNKRLFHYQLALIPSGERILLTLPEGFCPGPYDSKALAGKGVEILYLPTHLSLGESVVFALNLIEFDPKEPLHILHGDTLFKELPPDTDLIGLSQVEDNYDWAEYDAETGLLNKYQAEQPPRSELIVNGFFSFSAPKTFIRHIITGGWDFIEGLNGYIRDKGLTPCQFDEWYDFGHSQTYYQSKTRMTTQRAFNEMAIAGHVVTKSSQKKFKLAAEANWYQSIPGPLRIYTPQLLATEETSSHFGYSIEYLHLTALNELYVFSQLPAFAWRKILKACCQFLKDAARYKTEPEASFHDLFAGKTLSRLQQYARQSQVDIQKPLIINGKAQPSLVELAENSLAYLPLDNQQMNVLHGDFCFSNILYDFRTCSIKVIDPRGINASDQPCIHGNTLYDVAKLAHSVIGLYDSIIAGYFCAKHKGDMLHFEIAITERREKIMADFVEQMHCHFGIDEIQLCAMQIQLFISMLPLHNDRPDRQLGFIGNAYRLYDKIQMLSGTK